MASPACLRCHNPICTWEIPKDYENSLIFSEEEQSAEKIQEIYNNCLVIHAKKAFYVSADGQLNGYFYPGKNLHLHINSCYAAVDRGRIT